MMFVVPSVSLFNRNPLRIDLLFAVSRTFHFPFFSPGRTHILDGPAFGGWVSWAHSQHTASSDEIDFM